MKLCTFSKSEIHHDKILPSCPLFLNTKEAAHCPCRKRLYNVKPGDLRVLSCTYPTDYRGEYFRDELQVKLNIQKRLNKGKPPKLPKPPKPKKEKKMTNAIATAAPAGEPDKDPKQPATGLTIYDKIASAPIPTLMNVMKDMGQTFFDSKLFGCASPAMGRALFFGFLTNKIDPFSWKARHHIIGGNITMSAEAMLADFRTAGGTHRIIERTFDKASVELQVKREKQVFSFTWEEALEESYVWKKDAADDPKKRRLPNGQINTLQLKDNYSTPRRRMQMLWARVVSDGVGAMAPEISAGQQTPEELGVISTDINDGVIDAEFTVLPPSVSPEGQAAATSSPTSSPSGMAQAKPAVAPSEAVPPQVQLQAEPTTNQDEKLAALREFAALKRQLLTDDQYKAICAKRNVASVKELDLPQITYLVDGLRARLEKKKAAEGTDEVSQWANNALGGSSGN